MVHSTEGPKDLTWFGQLGFRAKERKGSASPEGRSPSSGFEFAEMLEQGLGPGTSSSFVDPASKRALTEQRLFVVVDPVKNKFTLTDGDKRPLLDAYATRDGPGFDIFVVRSGEVTPEATPTFELRGNSSKDQWTLCSVRCEQCEARGKRQCGVRSLARMTQYIEPVGDGHAFCMDVELPESYKDGKCEVICSVCGDPDAEIGKTLMTTRRPRWNARQKSLTLDFKGRCAMASAKNFQLEAASEPGKTRLLFGKATASSFVLDYQHPLGAVQAFSTALTTAHWK